MKVKVLSSWGPDRESLINEFQLWGTLLPKAAEPTAAAGTHSRPRATAAAAASNHPEPQPEAAAQEMFGDNFDGTALAADWEVRNEKLADFIVDGGELVLLASAGSLDEELRRQCSRRKG